MLMKAPIVAVNIAALLIVGSAACSSGPPHANPKRGVLPPGTARLTIDNDAATTESVQCAAVDSSTTMRTGDNTAGAMVMISNSKKLTVEFVRIRNLNGFTGDYNRNLEGDASAALTDATYHITGTALGYTPKSIAPTQHPFAIEVAC